MLNMSGRSEVGGARLWMLARLMYRLGTESVVLTRLIVVHRYRTAANGSGEVLTRVVVVSGELVSFELQRDVG